MALSKRVVLSQIEVTPNGTLQIRLDKQVVEDDAVLSREYHRTVLEPGIKVDDQVGAVNAHLFLMGWPPIDEATVERIRRIAKVEHTRDVVKAHRSGQKVAAENAR